PVKEEPFMPVPPKELSVFDVDHPRPSDEADAAALRAYMTRSSDAQLDALRQNPTELTAMLRVALLAMVVDYQRDEAKSDRKTMRPPERWNGDVVIWAHPRSSESLENSPAARVLHDAGVMVVAVDYLNPGAPSSRSHPPFPGYELG